MSSTQENLAMNIVNQLADLWGVPVEVRQNTNDQADKFVQALIDSATREAAAEGYKKGYIDAGIKALTEQSGERDAD